MRRSNFLIVVCMIAGIAVLCGLGMWQINRLAWKEALIAQIAERSAMEPRSISEIANIAEQGEDFDYFKVIATGTYDHANEVYFYTVRKGLSGWDVYTPLVLENGLKLVVNRGIVPYEDRDPLNRQTGQLNGLQKVKGFARSPSNEKPNFFIPENSPEKREFYWRNLDQMVSVMSNQDENKFLPFILEADETPLPGGWPRGGGSLVSLPNSHFQYALTWFGLALALLGVGSYFLYSRRS